MPQVFKVGPYWVYFWANEGDPLEPVHVHIAQKISANATKIWILSDGSAELENNNSRIPLGDLRKLMRVIEAYSPEIVAKWEQYFGEKAVFRDLQK